LWPAASTTANVAWEALGEPPLLAVPDDGVLPAGEDQHRRVGGRRVVLEPAPRRQHLLEVGLVRRRDARGDLDEGALVHPARERRVVLGEDRPVGLGQLGEQLLVAHHRLRRVDVGLAGAHRRADERQAQQVGPPGEDTARDVPAPGLADDGVPLPGREGVHEVDEQLGGRLGAVDRGVAGRAAAPRQVRVDAQPRVVRAEEGLHAAGHEASVHAPAVDHEQRGPRAVHLDRDRDVADPHSRVHTGTVGAGSDIGRRGGGVRRLGLTHHD
jgi:hypothetical protein